jgi:nucleoside-diphosphate-sugar epimerase
MIRHHNETPAYPERVVILGGSGFIGKVLAARLRAAGVNVAALSSADVDLCSPQSVDKLVGTWKPDDAVVFASCVTPDRGKDIAAAMRNVTMGQHVAAALERSPAAQLVYVSSDAVYADDVTLAHETARCEPATLYGMAHLMRERMMETIAAAKQLPLFILRSSLVYGAGDTHNSYGPNRFRRMAAEKGQIDLFGGGEETRDHIFVGDVCSLIELALTHKSAGVLNAATGVSTSFFEVAGIVAELAGGVKVVCSPRRNPITHRKYDITSTLKAYPSFRFTPLREGLAECAAAATRQAGLQAVA